MIDRLRLLVLLNAIDCHCRDCLWQQVDDIADAVASGNATFGADGDQVIALHATREGMSLLRQTPLLPDTTA
jgi:hypothetical protein